MKTRTLNCISCTVPTPKIPDTEHKNAAPSKTSVYVEREESIPRHWLCEYCHTVAWLHFGVAVAVSAAAQVGGQSAGVGRDNGGAGLLDWGHHLCGRIVGKCCVRSACESAGL